MNALLRGLTIIAIFDLPAAFVIASMVRLRLTYDAAAELPFTAQPVRLPGQSAREKADKLWEMANDKMLLVLLACSICGMAAAFGSVPRPAVAAIWILLFGGSVLWLGVKAKESLQESWNFRLGSIGEQVVGRELDRLIATGYRVFHDLSFETWNIDHVVVGPPGVFAVDTKTRRKPELPKGEKATVVLQGMTLNWEGATDGNSLEDARRCAKSLEKMLRKELGSEVAVVPVIAIPGWWLKVDRYSDVAVYSATDMSDYMPKRGRAPLQASEVHEIGQWLAKRCEIKLE